MTEAYTPPRPIDPETSRRLDRRGRASGREGGRSSGGGGRDGAEPNGGAPEQARAALPDSEDLRALIAQGRERGYLTFEEISETLEEVEVTKEQVQGLHAHLIEHGVDVIAEDGAHRLQGVEGRGPAGPAKKAELDLTVEPSLDSLRLYLRSIGRVELLTADQEIALAKRIEKGDMVGQAAHGRGEPAAGRLDRQGLSRPRAVASST